MKLFRVTCSKDIFTQSYILVQKIYSLRVDAAAPFLCGELDEKTTEIANNPTCSGDSILKNWQNGPRARQSFSFQKFTGTLKSNIFGKFANTFLLLQGTIANKNIRNQKGAKKISPGQF